MFAKYGIEQILKDETYTRFKVPGLTTLWCDTQKTCPFNGACALLQNPAHPGYATLRYVYHQKQDEDIYRIEFSPLYDQDLNEILIRCDHDVLYCAIDTHNGYHKECAQLTFWNNGVIEF